MTIFPVLHNTKPYAAVAQIYAQPTSVRIIKADIAAGPINRVLFIAIEFNDMALSMSFFSTRLGIIEVRTGWFIAKPAPRPNANT